MEKQVTSLLPSCGIFRSMYMHSVWRLRKKKDRGILSPCILRVGSELGWMKPIFFPHQSERERSVGSFSWLLVYGGPSPAYTMERGGGLQADTFKFLLLKGGGGRQLPWLACKLGPNMHMWRLVGSTILEILLKRGGNVYWWFNFVFMWCRSPKVPSMKEKA